MSSQGDKKTSEHVKAAIIAGIFVLLAALVGGLFLVLNTMIDKGTIVFEVSTPTGLPSSSPLVLSLRPACGSEYTIEAGRAIELHYGAWYAKGSMFAINSANHLTVTLLIDGQEIHGTKQDVRQVTTSWFPGASCGSIDYSDAYGTFYIANIDSLSAGTHPVQLIYSLDEQVIDGYDTNGTPNAYGPGELEPVQFTIVAKP